MLAVLHKILKSRVDGDTLIMPMHCMHLLYVGFIIFLLNVTKHDKITVLE